MIDRVRRAASASMPARSSWAGGTISRSLLSLSQRVLTPRLSSTSRSRLTSSMRATRRSVVRPWLSREAHSSATPAFFEVLTSMLPDSVVGPVTRRCVGPGAEGDDLGVERGADAGHHVEGEVLVALLDAVDRALAGAEHLGQLGLGPAAVPAGVADQVADTGQVVLSHGARRYLSCEIPQLGRAGGQTTGARLLGMRVATIHAPGDIRLEDRPAPTVAGPDRRHRPRHRGLHLRLRPLALPRARTTSTPSPSPSGTRRSASSRSSAPRCPASRSATSSSFLFVTATTPARSAARACRPAASTSA